MCLAIPGTAASEIQGMLDSKPISLDPEPSEQEGRQYVFDVVDNIGKLYGLGSVLEAPRVDGDPSTKDIHEAKYVPFKLTANTTLREFLDHACSDGTLSWGVVAGAVHLWPNEAGPAEPEYLDDVKVSLHLEGASVLEALKAWALEVNRNRPLYGHGVRINNPASLMSFTVPEGSTGYRATPASLTQEGSVTLSLADVTPREALCAIQAHSRQWIRIRYAQLEAAPNLVVATASEDARRMTPEVSAEERRRLNEEEDLDAVLVEPLAARQEGGEAAK
jgi:hypothetical protein